MNPPDFSDWKHQRDRKLFVPGAKVRVVVPGPHFGLETRITRIGESIFSYLHIEPITGTNGMSACCGPPESFELVEEVPHAA